MKLVVEIARRTRESWVGRTIDIDSVTYTLGIRPYRLLHRHELPKNYEFEEWENEEDRYFRKDGQIYNVREFCTSGCGVIPGPHGGAQMASNGYFTIAGYNGEIYPVSIVRERPVGMYGTICS